MISIKVRMFNRKASSAKSQSEAIVRTLSLQPGQHIADIGSGGGYFSLLFASLVGREGKVYAVDTNRDFLKFLKIDSEKKGFYNIETVLAEQDVFPVRDKYLDMAFLRNVYHHLPDRVNYFRNLSECLKKGARIAIIDYDGRGGLSFHRLFGHYVPKKTIVKEMEDAGYRLLEDHTMFAEQSFLIFSPCK
ncbi:MAG: methyltransferase domain-containing protein [Methanosarcinaceae archaeon]|nr:methyltransferase domain-containing protein [Methanosarcinaceae archaeon]